MTTILSLGCGLQSSTLLHLARLGEIHDFDYILFADTHAEPDFVYEHLFYLRSFRSDIKVISAGNLLESNLLHIPAFISNEKGQPVPLFRQCTDRFKIRPINKWIKENIKCEYKIALGISTDEQHRAVLSKNRYYPLIDIDMNRADCESFLRHHNLKVPIKSSCFCCPYHSNNYWLMLKKEYPSEFDKAVEYEKAINAKFSDKLGKSIFLHRSGKPLDYIDFNEQQMTLFDKKEFVCLGGCGM